MSKGTRSNGDTINENSPFGTDELRKMMHKILAEMGTITGEVSHLKGLDQTVRDLTEQITTSG